MHKFFRNLAISAIVLFCGLALYQISMNVQAAGAGTISSISTGTITYTGTSLIPYVFFTAGVDNGDLFKIYITTSNSSGNVGSYLATGTLTFANQGGQPWSGTLNFGTGFETYTGTSLYLHAFVTTSTGSNTGYLMQTLTFIPSSGGGGMSDEEWAALYTGTIAAAVSGAGINNNLNTVTSGNVGNFSGLWFEKPGSGKITFQTGLNLKDTGVQRFLENLSGFINIDNGLVSFNPTGTGADLNVNAQITMYFATGSDIAQDSGDFIALYSGNANMIVARDTGGNIMQQTGDFILSMIQAQCDSIQPCTLIFNTPHFTQFDIKPYLTAVHIQSSYTNPAYATSGHVVTLSFTGSEVLSGVTITMNGQTIAPIGGGTTRYGNFTVTGGTASGVMTFVVNYSDVYNNTGTTVTGTTDTTSVTVDNTAPAAPAFTTPAQTKSGGNITLAGTAENLATVNIYSGATLVATGLSNGTFGISVALIEGTNTFTAKAVDTVGNMSSASAALVITGDNTAPTASTITYTPSGATSGDVLATITGFSESITGLNATGYTFTGNGSFIFTFSDLVGNTGSKTATVTGIDKTAPTATVSYSPATATSGNVIATITGVSETITGTLTHTFAANGSYGFTFSDLVGNTGSVTGTVTWIDTTAPTLTGAAAVTNTTSQTPSYSITVSEAGTISYSGAGTCTSITSPTTAVSGVNTLTFNALSNATYTGCQLRVKDTASNYSSRLTIPTFTVNYTAPTGGGGGGGGSSSTGDEGTGTRIIPKGSGSVIGSTFSVEFNNAYLFAYDIGITTMNTIQKANMTGSLIRAHMAKMMVNYVIKVLNKYPNESTGCTFTDIADQTTELRNFIKRSCQLGLMGVNMTSFDPNGEVTRAQFGTVLSRALYGDKYNGGTPFYLNHLNALKLASIISNTDPTLRELRGYVMLMLMRAED